MQRKCVNPSVCLCDWFILQLNPVTGKQLSFDITCRIADAEKQVSFSSLPDSFMDRTRLYFLFVYLFYFLLLLCECVFLTLTCD